MALAFALLRGDGFPATAPPYGAVGGPCVEVSAFPSGAVIATTAPAKGGAAPCLVWPDITGRSFPWNGRTVTLQFLIFDHPEGDARGCALLGAAVVDVTPEMLGIEFGVVLAPRPNDAAWAARCGTRGSAGPFGRLWVVLRPSVAVSRETGSRRTRVASVAGRPTRSRGASSDEPQQPSLRANLPLPQPPPPPPWSDETCSHRLWVLRASMVHVEGLHGNGERALRIELRSECGAHAWTVAKAGSSLVVGEQALAIPWVGAPDALPRVAFAVVDCTDPTHAVEVMEGSTSSTQLAVANVNAATATSPVTTTYELQVFPGAEHNEVGEAKPRLTVVWEAQPAMRVRNRLATRPQEVELQALLASEQEFTSAQRNRHCAEKEARCPSVRQSSEPHNHNNSSGIDTLQTPEISAVESSALANPGKDDAAPRAASASTAAAVSPSQRPSRSVDQSRTSVVARLCSVLVESQSRGDGSDNAVSPLLVLDVSLPTCDATILSRAPLVSTREHPGRWIADTAPAVAVPFVWVSYPQPLCVRFCVLVGVAATNDEHGCSGDVVFAPVGTAEVELTPSLTEIETRVRLLPNPTKQQEAPRTGDQTRFPSSLVFSIATSAVTTALSESPSGTASTEQTRDTQSPGARRSRDRHATFAETVVSAHVPAPHPRPISSVSLDISAAATGGRSAVTTVTTSHGTATTPRGGGRFMRHTESSTRQQCGFFDVAFREDFAPDVRAARAAVAKKPQPAALATAEEGRSSESLGAASAAPPAADEGSGHCVRDPSAVASSSAATATGISAAASRQQPHVPPSRLPGPSFGKAPPERNAPSVAPRKLARENAQQQLRRENPTSEALIDVASFSSFRAATPRKARASSWALSTAVAHDWPPRVGGNETPFVVIRRRTNGADSSV